MDFNNTQFMILGSLCNAIPVLKNNRIHGPVDNILSSKGLISVIDLFNGNFEKEILSTPKIEKGGKNQNEIIYTFPSFSVVHNDATNPKFFIELGKRLKNLENFYKNINDDDKYFVYAMGPHDATYPDFKLTDSFKEGIRQLKELGILDKIIFLGFVQKVTFGYRFYHSDEVKQYTNKYIEIHEIDFNEKHDANNKEFIEALKAL